MAIDTQPANTGQMMGGGTLKKTCRHCGAENVFIVPKFEIINAYGASMLCFPHPEPQHCEKCQKPYQMVLMGVEQIAVSFMPIKDNNKGNIITVPAGTLPI